MFNRYNINDFGNRLKIIRKDRKISQDKLADNIPITRGSVIAWEKDNNSRIPSVETMVRLCELLDCDLDYLLGRCDTFHRETAEISETTGLSTEAADTLRKWKSISDKQGFSGFHDEVSQVLLRIKTLNTLLANKEGLGLLDTIGIYLHGRLIRSLSREEQATIEHDHMAHVFDTDVDTDASAEEIETAYKAAEDELDFEKKTVTFEIEGWDMLWTMDTDSIKSMFLSSIQESLVKLKTQIDTAKGEEGGAEDGNSEETR